MSEEVKPGSRLRALGVRREEILGFFHSPCDALQQIDAFEFLVGIQRKRHQRNVFQYRSQVAPVSR
jgi:hypothetical protein